MKTVTISLLLILLPIIGNSQIYSDFGYYNPNMNYTNNGIVVNYTSTVNYASENTITSVDYANNAINYLNSIETGSVTPIYSEKPKINEEFKDEVNKLILKMRNDWLESKKNKNN